MPPTGWRKPNELLSETPRAVRMREKRRQGQYTFKFQRDQLKKKFYNQRKRLREKKGVSDEERQAQEAAREEQEAAEIAELTAAWEQYGGCPEGAQAQQKANESSYAGVRDDKGGFASGPPRPAPPRQDYYALEDPNSDYYMDEMPPEPMQPAGYQDIANTDYSPHEHRDGHAAYQNNYQHQNASQNQNNYQQDVQIGDGANQQLQFGATAMDDFITADLWDDMLQPNVQQPNVQQLLDLNAPPYSPLFLMCCKCSNDITPFADPPPPHQHDSSPAPSTEPKQTPQDPTNQPYPEPMDTSETPKTPVLTPDEFDLSSELNHELFGLDTPGSLPDDGPDGGFHPYPSNPATSILFFPETSETSPQYLNTAVAAGKPDVSDGSSVEELRPRNVDSQVIELLRAALRVVEQQAGQPTEPDDELSALFEQVSQFIPPSPEGKKIKQKLEQKLRPRCAGAGRSAGMRGGCTASPEDSPSPSGSSPGARDY